MKTIRSLFLLLSFVATPIAQAMEQPPVPEAVLVELWYRLHNHSYDIRRIGVLKKQASQQQCQALAQFNKDTIQVFGCLLWPEPGVRLTVYDKAQGNLWFDFSVGKGCDDSSVEETVVLDDNSSLTVKCYSATDARGSWVKNPHGKSLDLRKPRST